MIPVVVVALAQRNVGVEDEALEPPSCPAETRELDRFLDIPIDTHYASKLCRYTYGIRLYKVKNKY